MKSKLIALFVSILLTSCTTILDIVDRGGQPGIYGGVRGCAYLIQKHGSEDWPLFFIIGDIPFSFVADTCILPFSISCTLIDMAKLANDDDDKIIIKTPSSE